MKLLLLSVLLLSACALEISQETIFAPTRPVIGEGLSELPVEIMPLDPDEIVTIELIEGRPVSVGNVTLVLVAVADGALLLIDGDQVVVDRRPVQVHGMAFRLIDADEDRILEPRPSFVDFTLRFPLHGSVRDTLLEGETKSYDIVGVTYDVTLAFVGYDERGEDTAMFSVDGQGLTATRREDTALDGGWLYVHEIYRVRPGSTIGLDTAILEIRRNQ